MTSNSKSLIYMNSLTQTQSIPTARLALYTLLSSSTTNPRVICLQTPVYHESFGDSWKTVEELSDLRAAGSMFSYLPSSNQPSNYVTVGELVRLIDKGEIDGMTMLTSPTYPAGGGGGWKTMGDEGMAELKMVVQMLSKGDETFVGEKGEVEEAVYDEGGRGITDELQEFLKSTEGMKGSGDIN